MAVQNRGRKHAASEADRRRLKKLVPGEGAAGREILVRRGATSRMQQVQSPESAKLFA